MISRYQTDSAIRGGTILSSAASVSRIRLLYRQGRIPIKEKILKDGERLDVIAGKEFGNSTLWWVIAALSNIGWGLQTPPGTIIKIPTNIQDILEII